MPQRGRTDRTRAPRRRRRDPAPTGPVTARGVVFERLADDATRFPDIVPRPLSTDGPTGSRAGGLSERDAAFAHALYDAVIKRWWTLQAIVAPRLNQPFIETETRLRAALLGGAAQLVLLDRVPQHAAISETVEWAKEAIRPGAGKLVNAVLRRVAELVGEQREHRARWDGGRDSIPLADGRSLALAHPVLPHGEIERLSAAASIPRPLLETWHAEHGADAVRELALHALMPAPVILNTTHADSPPGPGRPHDRAGFVVVPPESEVLGDLLNTRDDLWVQDPTSAEAVASVADLNPGLIVDVCAGKGTKTRQLAAVFPGAEIIATDTDRERYAVLERVFAGHPRVRVVPMTGLLDAALGRAGLVLLDVPCSNSGVLARRPEAKYRVLTGQNRRLLETQRQIIADAVRLLAPAGSILYSTCSLQRDENQGQAEWAKRWHGFDRHRERTALPRGVPGDPPAAYQDGGYSVLLTRGG